MMPAREYITPQIIPPLTPYRTEKPGARVMLVPANPMATTPRVLTGKLISLPAIMKSSLSETHFFATKPAPINKPTKITE